MDLLKLFPVYFFTIGFIFSLVGSLLGIYCFAGIIIEVLLFAKVLK